MGNDSFKEGCRVRHPKFGMGTVLSVNADTVDVQFDSLETKRTILREFPLIPVANPANAEEVARELLYTMGLVANLRERLEDSGHGDMQSLSQVDAIGDKLRMVLQML